MNTRILVALAAALVIATPTMASAQVPAEVPIQGYLTDDTGGPIDGSIDITFTVYDALTGGTDLHTETHTVAADAGAFTAYLTPDLQIFEDYQELYLGLAVDGGEEMSPRLQMATVPYAAVAGNATTLQGQTANELGAPDWSDIQNVPADLADGDDGASYSAISPITLNGNDEIGLTSTCAAGQLLKWNGNQWFCQNDTDTTYGAGTGLELDTTNSPAEFRVAPDGISSTEIADDSIADADISSTAAISPSKISGTAATLDSSPTFSGTVTASDVVLSNPRSASLTISPYDFVEAYPTEAEEPFFASQGYMYVYDGLSAPYNVVMRASVALPNGVTVTGFTCEYLDNSSTSSLGLYARLQRAAKSGTPAAPYMAAATVTNTSDSSSIQQVTDTTIGFPVIDNANHSYFINLTFAPEELTSSLRFYGCTLTYEYSTL